MRVKHIRSGIAVLLCIAAFAAIYFYSAIRSEQDKDTVEVNIIEEHDFIFDTIVKITVYLNNDNDGNKEKYTKIIEDAFVLCRSYEKKFSRTIPESEIYKLNNATGEFVTVSDDTKEMIEKAMKYSEITDGLYDITICSVSELWDFKSENPEIPDEIAIKKAVNKVGYKNIVIDTENINNIKLLNGAKIDLGSIAKGFTADRIAEFLKSEGVTHAIINLGGNVVSFGGKDESTPFNIGVKKPFGTSDEVTGFVKAYSKSIVSSGVYERYFIGKDDKIYHHILNPATGYPTESDIYSVTIISDLSIDGDILSTVCFLLGEEKGISLINSIGNTECIYYFADGTIKTSNGIKVAENGEFLLS